MWQGQEMTFDRMVRKEFFEEVTSMAIPPWIHLVLSKEVMFELNANIGGKGIAGGRKRMPKSLRQELTGLTQGMERSFDEDAERNTKSKREREACHMELDSPRKFVCVCVFF